MFKKLFKRSDGVQKPLHHYVQINDATDKVIVKHRQTILQAALEAGIRFPHLCRVGSCGNCQCRVMEGRVDMLIDASYVLSAQDLRNGHILACQAVLKSDARIVTVNPVEESAAVDRPLPLKGKIVATEFLTPRVFQMQIQMENALHYAAGQYMHFHHPALEGPRAYSLVRMSAQSDTDVRFHISPAPNGALAELLKDRPISALINQDIHLTGPYGDFGWPDNEPGAVLCAAGGSGIGVMVSILEQALRENQSKRVVFMYGARRQQDLYWIDRLQDLQRSWPQPFELVPVLSEDESDEAGWHGRRGLLADAIRDMPLAGQALSWHGLLCGPPAMVDSVMQALIRQGFSRDKIRFDKFSHERMTKGPAAYAEQAMTTPSHQLERI